MTSSFDAMVAAFGHTCLSMTVADLAQPDSPIVYCNDAFTALTGYGRDEVLGRNCRFLQGADTDRAEVARLAAALRANRSHRAVLLNYRRDGERFLNELITTPLRDDTGRMRYVLGVQRELGTRDPAGQPVHLRFRRRGRLDVDVERIGENAASLLAAPAAVLEAKDGDIFDYVAEDERDRVDRALRKASEQGQALQLDVRVAGPRYHVRWVRLQAAPRADGGDGAFDGTLVDVTQQKLITSRLELFEAVSVHARDAIVITEADARPPGPRIVYVNDSFTRITGYDAQEVVGQSPRLLQGPDTDPATTAQLADHFRRWRPVEATLLNYRRDGTPFWNELSIVPVADATGWYTHWIAIQRDVTERRRMQERVTFLAYHDHLTRLANRTALGERLRTRCRAGDRAPFSLMQVDLDRFKAVNDRWGHAVGDLVLCEVARRLERCAPEGAFVARLGGDEFVVLAEGVATGAAAEEMARRVRAALAPPFFWNGHAVPMGGSVGVARYPDDAGCEGGLLSAVDLALYAAKARDGGVARFDRGLRTRLMEARQLEEELRDGLATHAFVLHLQPQWRLTDGAVVGVECLLRWRHPTRGLLSPGDFLGVAEESGLMGRLQSEVLALAMGAGARLRAAGARTGPLAVNLTVCELAEPGFAARLLARLADAGLEPHDLSVEVVERVFLDDNRATIVDNLEALHEGGVAVELDDFGTGFASLTHLRSFPIDRVKIDRSFVADLGADPQDATIVRAIIDLAHNLGMRVVAEGVESETQRAHLARWGCDSAQGHLRAGPMSEDALLGWLADRAELRAG